MIMSSFDASEEEEDDPISSNSSLSTKNEPAAPEQSPVSSFLRWFANPNESGFIIGAILDSMTGMPIFDEEKVEAFAESFLHAITDLRFLFSNIADGIDRWSEMKMAIGENTAFSDLMVKAACGIDPATSPPDESLRNNGNTTVTSTDASLEYTPLQCKNRNRK